MVSKRELEHRKKLLSVAIEGAYPNQNLYYDLSLKYSSKFKDYNANIKMNRRTSEIIISLSRSWESVSDDIKVGLIQELIIKLFKNKYPHYENTLNMELYSTFMKNIHIAAPKVKSDSKLLDSYDRVNLVYFNGLMDSPNLIWGTESYRKLGCYHYGSDTISISTVLKDADQNLLDYVIYHELLHKKHKFHSKDGRSYHHTTAFRNDEKKFKNFFIIEKELNNFVSRKMSRNTLNVFNSKTPKKISRKKIVNALFDYLGRF
jgi:predicted SprT family Zn-dependent metalloprotease